MNQKQKTKIGRLVILTIGMVYTCFYINVQEVKQAQNNLSIKEVIKTDDSTTSEQLEETVKEYDILYSSKKITPNNIKVRNIESNDEIIFKESQTEEEKKQELLYKIDKMKKDTNIYMDVNSKCSLSRTQFISVVSNLPCDKRGVIKRNADLIWKLGEKYEIDAIWATAVLGEESRWGNSGLAIEKNNLFSISNDKDGIEMKYFASEEECIERFFKLIHNCYLSEDGEWFMGTQIRDINFYFCPMHAEDCDCFDEQGNFIERSCDFDYSWSKEVVDCMYTIYNNVTPED